MREEDFIKILSGITSYSLKDDIAQLSPPEGFKLIGTTDHAIEGRHFFPHEDFKLVAQRLMHMNLSDIASCGARPWGYFLNVAIKEGDGDKLKQFALGLEEENKKFELHLFGGDTSKTKQESVFSLSMFGLISESEFPAMTRSNGKEGDLIFCTGKLGNSQYELIKHAKVPPVEALCDFGFDLRKSGACKAATDLSDGLYSDARGFALSSHVDFEIDTNLLPLSNSLNNLKENGSRDWLKFSLSSGDYQLLFTAEKSKINLLEELCKKHNVLITNIGKVKGISGSIGEVIWKGLEESERSSWDLETWQCDL